MSSMLELPPPFAESPPAHLRVVGDDRLDFDGAVRRITPHLQRYARRRLGDAHEAEELVQEALLRAYRQGESLRTEDDLTAWCTVVTGRLVIDRLRVRHRSVNVAEVPDGSRVGRDTAEVVVARDEARTALDALDAMPARQAAVLWAREVEGQGYEEIGRRFGMTEPAVRSILTRSRKALRKEYAARGGTLPVAGLAALAPWLGGLRWADRLRAAATRLAAPMAIAPRSARPASRPTARRSPAATAAWVGARQAGCGSASRCRTTPPAFATSASRAVGSTALSSRPTQSFPAHPAPVETSHDPHETRPGIDRRRHHRRRRRQPRTRRR